jgi:hypothetical protein
MGVASLHRKAKCGLRAPWNCAHRALLPSLASDTVSQRKAGRLLPHLLIPVSRLLSNLTYNRFEAFPWEVKRGFLIPVSSSCYGLIHPSVLRDGASGCAARQYSAA